MVKFYKFLIFIIGLFSISVTAFGSTFFLGSGTPLIANLNSLPAPFYVTMIVGQSRAANTAEGAGICYSTTTTPYFPLRSFMMNNPQMNGVKLHGDFQSSLATSLIPAQDCLYTSGPNVQAGQSLGAAIWYLQQDDDTYNLGIKTRGVIVTGESAQTIAVIGPGVDINLPPVTGVTGAINNGSGLIRLTTSNNIADGTTIVVSGVAGTSEANGTWTAIRIDNTHVDLAESTFVNAYVASSGIIRVGAGPFLGNAATVNVTNAVNNGSGLCRLTLSSLTTSTTTITVNSVIAVSGIIGSTECNGGAWKVSAVGANTVDLAESTFVNAYVSGGTAGGFIVYNRMKNMLSKMVILAAAAGKNTIVEMVPFLQGEANSDTPNATYLIALTNFLSSLRIDVATITGQVTAFDFIINPPNGSNITPSTSVQYDFCVSNGDGHTWCNGPEYQLPYCSNAHQCIAGVVQNAEQFGYARSRIERGLGNGTVYVTNFNIVGNTIVLTLNVPFGCIVLDTTTLPDATGTFGNTFYGFFYTDDAGNHASGASITGCKEITVSINGIPTTNKVLSYGQTGPGTAPPLPPSWGNFRDERAEASRFVPGLILRNWMLSFSKSIP